MILPTDSKILKNMNINASIVNESTFRVLATIALGGTTA